MFVNLPSGKSTLILSHQKVNVLVWPASTMNFGANTDSR